MLIFLLSTGTTLITTYVHNIGSSIYGFFLSVMNYPLSYNYEHDKHLIATCYIYEHVNIYVLIIFIVKVWSTVIILLFVIIFGIILLT